MRSAGPSKSRKPYKITKPREKWSDEEHGRFLQAIDRFGRNWKEIVALVGTRSVSQVRSHAQKHFIRLEKTGLGAGVPPARRKARWTDKQIEESLDGSTDSDQDISGSLNFQANSSSSMSTFDYHEARASAGSSAQRNDCHPTTSPDHSYQSLQSCSSSVSSASSQSVIAHAQEFLRHCNQNGVRDQLQLPSAQAQGLVPSSPRGAAMLAVLQRIASSQQGPPCPGSPSPSPGTVPSGPAVALRQRHLQQLLYHHSQPRTAFQPQFSQQKPTPIAQAAAFGAWPQHSPVSATPPTAPQPCFSTRAFTQPPEAVPAVLPDQQACPRLDGSFLAECIKPPVPLPCVVNSCNQSIQSSSPLPLANQAVLSAGSAPAAAALPVLVKTEVQPSAAMVSPALTFSSLPSTTSCLSAAPNADIAPGDGPYDCFGLDEDLWTDFDFEDPLMAVVDAAMECQASS
ncbi:hypothetical protein ABBQ32_013585 [Trebouxia sp. C0010 RCD-2024]